jgi:replicative DNA helicase
MSSLMKINYSNKDRATLQDATQEFIRVLKEGGRRLLSTGFDELDHLIPGVPTNSLVVIGADSGVGKTVFAINMALNKAKQGEKVLIISLEISFHDLIEILLPQVSDSEIGVTYQELIKNNHTVDEIERLEQLITTKLNGLGIYFACNCYNLEEIITTLDYHKKNYGIDSAIIDHTQLISGSNEYNTYTQITITLMQYKNRNDVSLTLLSQMNDNKDKRADKEPRKNDLRAGGNLYQDADIVLFLYKLEPNSSKVYLKISKNRKGANNSCKYLELDFNSATRRIYLSQLREPPKLEEEEEIIVPKRKPRVPRWAQRNIEYDKDD